MNISNELINKSFENKLLQADFKSVLAYSRFMSKAFHIFEHKRYFNDFKKGLLQVIEIPDLKKVPDYLLNMCIEPKELLEIYVDVLLKKYTNETQQKYERMSEFSTKELYKYIGEYNSSVCSEDSKITVGSKDFIFYKFLDYILTGIEDMIDKLETTYCIRITADDNKIRITDNKKTIYINPYLDVDIEKEYLIETIIIHFHQINPFVLTYLNHSDKDYDYIIFKIVEERNKDTIQTFKETIKQKIEEKSKEFKKEKSYLEKLIENL